MQETWHHNQRADGTAPEIFQTNQKGRRSVKGNNKGPELEQTHLLTDGCTILLRLLQQACCYICHPTPLFFSEVGMGANRKTRREVNIWGGVYSPAGDMLPGCIWPCYHAHVIISFDVFYYSVINHCNCLEELVLFGVPEHDCYIIMISTENLFVERKKVPVCNLFISLFISTKTF